MIDTIRLSGISRKGIARPAFLLAIILILSTHSAWASDKKGIGLADLNGAARITALNVSWYYTWQPKPIAGTDPQKFVPMLWGGNKLDRELGELRRMDKPEYLLAINEPDVRNQANMSVDETARLWPEIENLSDNISTPATSTVLSPWFDRFFRIAGNRNLKTDFMAIHLYTPPDAGLFLEKLDATYQKYHLPIWITEFAVADWDAAPWNCKQSCRNRYPEEQVLAFMQTVLPELEKRPYVIRYAWFGAGNFSLSHEQVRTSRLFEKDGTLTSLGKYYSQF